MGMGGGFGTDEDYNVKYNGKITGVFDLPVQEFNITYEDNYIGKIDTPDLYDGMMDGRFEDWSRIELSDVVAERRS